MRITTILHGLVQGVSFRRFVREQARGLGLVGWVRNLPGGTTVEVVAEGPRAALEEMLELLRDGAPRVWIDCVDAEWDEPRADMTSFEARF